MICFSIHIDCMTPASRLPALSLRLNKNGCGGRAMRTIWLKDYQAGKVGKACF